MDGWDEQLIPKDQNLPITGFWETAKNVTWLAKKRQNFSAIFVKRPIKPLGKPIRTQKTDCKNLFLSRSYKSLKFGPNSAKRSDIARTLRSCSSQKKKIFLQSAPSQALRVENLLMLSKLDSESKCLCWRVRNPRSTSCRGWQTPGWQSSRLLGGDGTDIDNTLLPLHSNLIWDVLKRGGTCVH